jgi:hypothetical protein
LAGVVRALHELLFELFYTFAFDVLSRFKGILLRDLH